MRSRIIRQLLTESILLAGLGGLAGLVVAYAGTRMLLLLAFPGATSVPIEASPSLVVIGFAFAISMITGILFGVAPAWIAAQAESRGRFAKRDQNDSLGSFVAAASAGGDAGGAVLSAAGGCRDFFAEPEQAAKHRI